MEFTNLAFAVLIAAVVISGFSYFYTNANSNYPNAPQISSNTTAQFNNETYKLNETISTATSQASQFGSSDNALAAAFGYLLGAFNAGLSLASIPQIFIGILGGLGEMMGIFFPSWLMPFIVAAVSTITLLGILYMWLKVK